MNYKKWSRKLEANILRVYESATAEEREEGLLWYSRARDFASSLALRYNLTLEQTAGVIAAVSPGRTWGGNLLDAEKLCEAYANGRSLPLVGSYGWNNIRKAEAILKGARPLDVLPLTGPKTRAFFFCIVNPTPNAYELYRANQMGLSVCVDRHAKCLALNIKEDREKASVVRAGAMYRFYAWHYEKLAERLGLLPHQLQAITWVTWKRMIDEYVPF